MEGNREGEILGDFAVQRGLANFVKEEVMRMRKLLSLLVLATLVVFTNARAEEGPVNVGGLVKASWVGQYKGVEPMFGVDQARFHLFGAPAEKVKYKIQFDMVDTFPNAGTVPYLSEGWVTLAAHDMVTVGIGQIKKPFGRDWTTDDSAMDFWGHSVLGAAFGDWVVGAWAVAKPMDNVALTLGGFNGTGKNCADNDQWPAIAARLVMDPMEALSVGASLYWNQDRKNAGNKNQIQFGIDAAYKMDPLKVTAEFGYENNTAAVNKSVVAAGGEKALALSLAGVYKLIDKHHVGLRYDMMKPDYDKGLDNHTIAGQYFYAFSNVVKAGFDLSYLKIRNAAAGVQDYLITYRAGAQAAF